MTDIEADLMIANAEIKQLQAQLEATISGQEMLQKALAASQRRANHIRDTTKKVSNADRIRSMSDEELAKWLVDATMCERVCIEEDYCGCDVCVNRVTDWLQQPAKEERHETD